MALEWVVYDLLDIADGKFSGELQYDRAAGSPTPLVAVRYLNSSTVAAGGQTVTANFYRPDTLPNDQPSDTFAIPPGTPLTVRNVQGLGLTMIANPRYPGTFRPNGWRLSVGI